MGIDQGLKLGSDISVLMVLWPISYQFLPFFGVFWLHFGTFRGSLIQILSFISNLLVNFNELTIIYPTVPKYLYCQFGIGVRWPLRYMAINSKFMVFWIFIQGCFRLVNEQTGLRASLVGLNTVGTTIYKPHFQNWLIILLNLASGVNGEGIHALFIKW